MFVSCLELHCSTGSESFLLKGAAPVNVVGHWPFDCWLFSRSSQLGGNDFWLEWSWLFNHVAAGYSASVLSSVETVWLEWSRLFSHVTAGYSASLLSARWKRFSWNGAGYSAVITGYLGEVRNFHTVKTYKTTPAPNCQTCQRTGCSSPK